MAKMLKEQKKRNPTQTLSLCLPSLGPCCEPVRAVSAGILPSLAVVGANRTVLALVALRVSVFTRNSAVS